jgi:hypothetical protein
MSMNRAFANLLAIPSKLKAEKRRQNAALHAVG